MPVSFPVPEPRVMPRFGLPSTRQEVFCRHFVAGGPDRSAPPDRTEPHMTFHDILHTPLPVIPTGRQRAEGTRLDPDDGNPESVDGIPPFSTSLRAGCSDHSGRNDGSERNRPARSVWETMHKTAQDGSGRRAENGGFPPEMGFGDGPVAKKKRTIQTGLSGDGSHGGPGHIRTNPDIS